MLVAWVSPMNIATCRVGGLVLLPFSDSVETRIPCLVSPLALM